jgi:murein L,D-transpeptidase YcbB/YkuD
LNPEKIDEAMHAGKENGTHLKQNPVYIGYFTAWEDTDGILYFMMILSEKRSWYYCFNPE